MSSAVAGSSGAPLAKKLAIKEGSRVAVVHAPESFFDLLGPLPPGVEIFRRVRGPLDLIVFFTKRSSQLVRRFPVLARALAPAGGLWIAWPKQASGVPTDLSFQTVQAIGLAAGLVDNKVCAIDEIWSGVRFVFRLKDR